MESEDEMAVMMTDDSNDEEEFYGGGDDEDDDSALDDFTMDYDGFMDQESDDSDDFSASDHLIHHRSQNYTILDEDDIRRLQEENITKVSTVLSISRVAAGILLRHFNWSVSKVNDEWFADEEKVRKAVGLLEHHIPLPDAKELTCGVCFEDYPRDRMSAAACGHPFCAMCWQGYIDTAINDGPGCLMLRCPEPSCGAAIGQDMVNKLASVDDREKYNHYFLRSFVEDNRKTKWCPAPGCDYAVDFIVGGGSYDVTCCCSHCFCWNCVEEAHRPVDCGTVAKWILKNSAESENMNWILANSKPCPKCKRPIEKNQGCMHITCTPPCKFEFCWLCLGAWSEHGERTGGFYACNRYDAAKQEGVYDETEKRREMAKNSLERYTHYYERWATNQSSRQRALENLHQMQTVHLEKLSDKQCQPESQLKFIIEAWLQGRPLHRFGILKYLAPDESVEEVLGILRELARLVQGLWVPKSSSLYGTDHGIKVLARDYVLLLFCRNVLVKNSQLPQQPQLAKAMKEVLNVLATERPICNDWELKELPDMSFIKLNPSIVKEQDEEWRKLERKIDDFLAFTTSSKSATVNNPSA